MHLGKSMNGTLVLEKLFYGLFRASLNDLYTWREFNQQSSASSIGGGSSFLEFLQAPHIWGAQKHFVNRKVYFRDGVVVDLPLFLVG